MRGYSVCTGCNGSALAAAGGLGSLVARLAFGELEAAKVGSKNDGPRNLAADLEPWSISRDSLREVTRRHAVGSLGFQEACAAARAGKFGSRNAEQ